MIHHLYIPVPFVSNLPRPAVVARNYSAIHNCVALILFSVRSCRFTSFVPRTSISITDLDHPLTVIEIHTRLSCKRFFFACLQSYTFICCLNDDECFIFEKTFFSIPNRASKRFTDFEWMLFFFVWITLCDKFNDFRIWTLTAIAPCLRP